MRYGLLIGLLLAVIPSFSQSIEEALRNQFPNPSKVEFIKYYKGKMDDVNQVVLLLAHDGKICKGLMKYVKSETIFSLEGMIWGQRFQLTELDEAKNVTGILKGTIKTNTVEAQWHNFDRRIEHQLVLTETRSFEDPPTPCGEDKWYNLYIGKSSGVNVELILQKIGERELTGIAYLNGQGYELEGELDAEDKIQVYFKKYLGTNFAQLSGNFKNRNFFRATLIDEDGLSRNLTFKLKEQLRVGCVEYADFSTSFDFIYPKSKNDFLNDWLRKTINEWAQNCRHYAKRQREQTPESRGTQHASGWCQLDVYSNDLISGFLFFSSNWEPHKRGVSFNFDPKADRFLTFDDLFKPHFNQNQFIKNIVPVVFKNHPLYGDELFRNWIENEATFPHFILRRDGINFSTDFDPIFGRQNVTIPIEELKPYLNEHPVFRKINN
ncbi:MAG: hypothetical protein D6714_00970 [Bacteroidetes bacterium]|nr:MAG: hypothetical protein D6714_00970 [Bacteroidota bacterium]